MRIRNIRLALLCLGVVAAAIIFGLMHNLPVQDKKMAAVLSNDLAFPESEKMLDDMARRMTQENTFAKIDPSAGGEDLGDMTFSSSQIK